LRIPNRKAVEPQKSPDMQGGPKFIILRHQSGNNYLQPVPNNVISLNPGLKIRPISELSSKAQNQAHMVPTSVPQSVLKLLKEQQISEPPQLTQISPKPNMLSILKPREMPNVTQSKAVQCSSSEADNDDSLQQKKPCTCYKIISLIFISILSFVAIQSLLEKIIDIEHKRLDIEKNRLDFEKKIGSEIVSMLKKLTDS
jgi:hypothetical protein